MFTTVFAYFGIGLHAFYSILWRIVCVLYSLLIIASFHINIYPAMGIFEQLNGID